MNIFANKITCGAYRVTVIITVLSKFHSLPENTLLFLQGDYGWSRKILWDRSSTVNLCPGTKVRDPNPGISRWSFGLWGCWKILVIKRWCHFQRLAIALTLLCRRLRFSCLIRPRFLSYFVGFDELYLKNNGRWRNSLRQFRCNLWKCEFSFPKCKCTQKQIFFQFTYLLLQLKTYPL